jgi:hypothetical protein
LWQRVQKVRDTYTVVVKPWWLYRDYASDHPALLYGGVGSVGHGSWSDPDPGGSSGIELSNNEAWDEKRDEIRERVAITRTMTPEGHALPDDDREKIRAWITRNDPP